MPWVLQQRHMGGQNRAIKLDEIAMKSQGIFHLGKWCMRMHCVLWGSLKLISQKLDEDYFPHTVSSSSDFCHSWLILMRSHANLPLAFPLPSTPERSQIRQPIYSLLHCLPSLSLSCLQWDHSLPTPIKVSIGFVGEGLQLGSRRQSWFTVTVLT